MSHNQTSNGYRLGCRSCGGHESARNGGRDGRKAVSNVNQRVRTIDIGYGNVGYTKGINEGHGNAGKERLAGVTDTVAVEVIKDRSGNGTGGLETNRRSCCGNACSHGDGLWIVGRGKRCIEWVGYVNHGSTNRYTRERVGASAIGNGCMNNT